MNNDDIIRLAIEHTVSGLKFNEDGLLRFADLVAAAEREAISGKKHEGWRKRQINSVLVDNRNDTIEEVAHEIEKMKAFGPDTIASFASYVRNMKDAKT